MASDEPPHPEGDLNGAGAADAGLRDPRDKAGAAHARFLAMERALVDGFYGGSWSRYCAAHGLPEDTDRSAL